MLKICAQNSSEIMTPNAVHIKNHIIIIIINFLLSLLVSRRQWFQYVSLFKRWGDSMPLTAFVGRIQTAHATLSSRTGEQKSRCVHAVNETKRADNQMNDVKRRNFNRGTFIMYIETMRTNLKLTNFQRN